MSNLHNLLSKAKDLLIGPATPAGPAPDMTREQVARLKAQLFDRLGDDEVVGFPTGSFSLSTNDMIGLIRLAEKSFALEDAAARDRE